MTVIARNIIPSKLMESAQTTQYTATNCSAIIDVFTATNTSAANALVSVYLVAGGTSPSTSNQIVRNAAIAPGETYTFPELSGQVLAPNSYITAEGTASALTIRASGREIT